MLPWAINPYLGVFLVRQLKVASITLAAVAIVIGLFPTWQIAGSDYATEEVTWIPISWASAFGYGAIGISAIWGIAFVSIVWSIINSVLARSLLWPGLVLIASLAVLPLAIDSGIRPSAAGWVGLAFIFVSGLLAVASGANASAANRTSSSR